jgi:integral membrane sensor domain MASE1
MATGSLAAQDSRFYRVIEAIRRDLADAFATENLLTLFVLAVAYFVSGKFGQKIAIPSPSVTAFWPPAGISLAAVLLRGRRVWPAIFVASFFVNLTRPPELPGSLLTLGALGIGTVNAFTAVIGALLVKRFANGTRAFYTPRDVLRFVSIVATVPLLFTATIGMWLLCSTGSVEWANYWQVWKVWYVGDLAGMILLTPFLVLLLGHKHHPLGVRELTEATLLLVGLIVVCVLNFGPMYVNWIPRAGLLYLALPFLAWSALRFCPLEASGTTLLMSGFAMWGSMHGYGPYQNTTSAPTYVVGYVVVASTMTLVIAAACAQQRQEAADLMELYYATRKAKEEEVRLLQETVESLRNNDPNERMN